MRILITSDIFPPDVGGPATYVPYVAEQLSERGHRVTVLTYSVPRFHSVDSNYRFEVVRVSLAPPQWRRILRTVSTIIGNGRGKDVIYANGLVTESVLAGTVLRKPMVAKVVGDLAWERARDKGWTVDSFEDFQAKRYAFKVELLRWRRSFSYRHMLHIIVPSQYLKDALVKHWALPAARITVIYNAFQAAANEMPAAAVNLPVEHKMITVCRLTRWKGVDGLIRVLPELPNLGLIVVGDGPARADLVRLAQRLCVDERVHFSGTVAKERVPAYLRASDLFVLNSTYEGLPHVLLEAMAAGLPVIATNAGGSGEIVEHGHNGLLIPPRDTGALLRALLRMLGSPAERMNMVRNGRDTLGKFNPQHMVEQTEAVLLSTAGRTPV